MKKRFFVEILKEICNDEGLKIEIYSHEWLCKITDPATGKNAWTEGYNFDLNSAVNYITLYDKVSTTIVLVNNKVPCVEHFLIMKEQWRQSLEIGKSWKEEITDILKITGPEVVVKFATGSQGNNVYLCKSESEVTNVVSLLKDKQSLAVSKYYESEFEYRFYILEDKILFAYKKIKANKSEWKHNLSQGARAEVINHNYQNYNELSSLALQAFSALKLRCGAVDILETQEGLKVMEVNNGIMMDSFSATNNEYYQIAKNAHKQMLYLALNK